jgi:hypothetical protein
MNNIPKALVMEVNAKGGGLGGGQQDEGGRWVGRNNRVGWLGFRFRTWGQGWAKT